MIHLSAFRPRTMLYAFILLVLGGVLFACTRRKSPPDNLAAWLELHFPGRFEIVDTQTEDPIRNMSFKIKRSVVADKSDPLLQIQLRWDKREPGLGLSPESVDSGFARARPVLADARALLDALKAAGLNRVCAGIRNGDAQVLLFEEPTPEYRKQTLSALKTALGQWPAAGQYGLTVQFMEPAVWKTEFGDIVPLAHWVRQDSWQTRKTILLLSLSEGDPYEPRAAEQALRINTGSERLGQWADAARPLAERWAAEHLKKPYAFFTNLAQYEAMEQKPGALLGFPFTHSGEAVEGAEIDGYVVGEYGLDSGTYERLRVEKAD